MKHKIIKFALLPLIIFPIASCGEREDHIKGELITKSNEVKSFMLDEFKDVTFLIEDSSLKDNKGNVIVESWLKDVFVADVNNDGYRDICTNLSVGSGGFINDVIYIYDYKNEKVLYEKSERYGYDYCLNLNEKSYLIAYKYQSYDRKLIGKGYLSYLDNKVQIERSNSLYETTGLDYELFLYESKELKELKVETKNDVKSYILNSFSTFALKVKATNDKNFELFRYEIEKEYTYNCSITNSYEDTDGSRVFLIEFYDRPSEGIVSLQFLGLEMKFNYIIDNENACWGYLKTEMQDVVTWMKPLNKENVTKVCYEDKPGSIAPGSIYSIYYSADKTVISDLLEIKNNKVFETHLDSPTPGGGADYYRFYTNDEVYELRESSSCFYYSGDNYRFEGDVNVSSIKKLGEEYLKLVLYSDYIEVQKYNNPEKRFFIDFLKNIEFIEWPSEEKYEEVDPTFISKNMRATAISMNIYSPTRFSMVDEYGEKMYKVMSEINFSSIF